MARVVASASAKQLRQYAPLQEYFLEDQREIYQAAGEELLRRLDDSELQTTKRPDGLIVQLGDGRLVGFAFMVDLEIKEL